MNWVDWIILVVLAIGVLNGLRQGLVRQVIGFGALIVAFFAASWFHGLLASSLREYISDRTAAMVTAYILIFVGVIVAGALIASLIVRIFKLIGLSPVDRLLGGAFGVVQTAVGLMIIAMVLMAFAPTRMPGAVRESQLAPYVIGASRVLSSVAPYEIRHGVEKTYSELRQKIDRYRPLQRPPVREE